MHDIVCCRLCKCMARRRKGLHSDDDPGVSFSSRMGVGDYSIWERKYTLHTEVGCGCALVASALFPFCSCMMGPVEKGCHRLQLQFVGREFAPTVSRPSRQVREKRSISSRTTALRRVFCPTHSGSLRDRIELFAVHG